MKQFGKILKFELKNYFQNKVFVGITALLVVLIIVVMFFPRIMGIFEKDSEAAEYDRPVLLLVSDSTEYTEIAEQAFSNAFTEYEVIIADNNIKNIEEQIINGTAQCAFVLNSLTSYDYYVNNLEMYDTNTIIADEILQNLYQVNAMTEGGIPVEEVQKILATQIAHETVNLGKDQAENFFYTYIMIFALYMVILLYGQMVATNVATEKSSRAMEVLITSAKPVSMMFGKVIASCLAGLIQLLAVFGTSFVCFNLNKSYWDENGVIASIFDMPIELLIYMLVFFILGFFIYAFMFGAVGSTASKLEDINTSCMPVTLLFIVGFMVVVFSMTSGNVENILMKICSYIPFTSPMAMFTRIAMSTVPVYEIVFSIIVLIASVAGVGVISAKIYRVGVLLYGTTPKVGDILKAMRNA